MAKVTTNRVVNRKIGILGNPDPQPLWQDIMGHLSKIPFYRGMKILNICAGHGTEAQILAKHLRIELGWSRQEIEEAIYLIDIAGICTREVKRLGFKHIFTDDLLSWKAPDGMLFDLVIGNPPYAQETWVKFVAKSHEFCKPSGYIALVTPTNWVYIYHKSHKLVTDYEPLALHNDVRDSAFPGVAESIGYFIIKKEPIKNTITKMIGKDGVEYEYNTEKYMVPRGLVKVVHSIIAKSLHSSIMHEPFKCENRDFQPEKSDERQYSSLNHTWGMNYTSKKVVNPGQPKAILSRLLRRNGAQRTMVAFADYDGTMQINDGFYFYVQTPEEVDALVWLISESKLMRFISGYSDKSQYLSPALRVSVPQIPATIKSDAELYSYFKFSEDEIKYIESNVK